MSRYIAKILILLLLTTPMLAGCQPTPEETIIVPGGDFEELMQETDVPLSQYEIPETWEEHIDSSGEYSDIAIDATITVPGAETVPIYNVLQTEINKAQAELITSYFSDEFLFSGSLTKPEIEQRIIQSKQQGDEEFVQYYEDMLEDAPIANSVEVIDDWTPQAENLFAYCEKEDGGFYLAAVNKKFIVCSTGTAMAQDMLKENGLSLVGTLNISENDAIKIATQELNKLNLNMTAFDIQKAALFPSTTRSGDFDLEGERKEGYYIRFSNNVDGIPGLVDNGFSFSPGRDTFEYKAPFHPQEVQLFIDESGRIERLELRNPLELEGKIVENTVLMPFDDAMDKIRDLLKFTNSYDNEMPLNVTDVSLNMTVVSVKNSPGEFIYIPVWVVSSYRDYDGHTQNEYLLINAIDGGRVSAAPLPSDLNI